MPHLSVATVIEKDRLHSDTAFVVALDIEIRDPETQELQETMYLVDNAEDITFQGETYVASAFEVDLKVESGSMPELTLGVTDYTKALEARMEAYDGGVGFIVRMMLVNTGNLSQPPEIEQEFEVIDAKSNNYRAEFRIGAENPLNRRFPLRMQHKDRCQWKYKSTECGYTGELDTCDFTLQGDNGCAAHGNSERFGGFPGIKPVSQ